MNLGKAHIEKTYVLIFFYDIIKLEDFDLDNILIDQNHIKIF